ncbi:hypothetical protein TNCT_2011 [Trichonephila clavata]|uniref:Uncharacterized protein n=1 Tax=Trichonephila clavata TaxID=2740835 RepID=A0A8X6I8K3_TRICU|nr:hypothetical protein TNCT_2011 [Trichonephila clavata]
MCYIQLKDFAICNETTNKIGIIVRKINTKTFVKTNDIFNNQVEYIVHNKQFHLTVRNSYKSGQSTAHQWKKLIVLVQFYLSTEISCCLLP